MTVQNHNHAVTNERPAPTVQDPVASGSTDRRSEYTYRGYDVQVVPNLTGYVWSVLSTKRMARSINSHTSIEDAAAEANAVIDCVIERYG